MTTALVLGLIAALISATGMGLNYYQNEKARKSQEEHDREMALLNQQLATEQFEKQNVDFNAWETNRGHMVEAGYNPALMYGQIPQTVSQAAGQGSAGNVGMKPDFSALKSMSPSEVGNLALARENSSIYREQMKSQTALNNQKALESASITAENLRNTKFQKSMEKLIYDRQTAELNQSNALTGYYKSLTGKADADTARVQAMTPLEVEKLGEEIGLTKVYADKAAKESTLIQKQIEREPLVRNQLRAEARRLNAAAGLDTERAGYIKNVETPLGEAQKELTLEQKRAIQEEIKSGQIGRFAREFGLASRRPNRKVKYPQEYDWKENEKAFCLTLVKAGFTPEEATAATMYYTFGNVDDLTPEYIRAASSTISALIHGASGLGMASIRK